MKKLKMIIGRTIPILLIVLITVGLSLFVYFRMIRAEEDQCWDRMHVATETMAEKIEIRFSDNMNLLERVADAIIFKGNGMDKAASLDYLRTVCSENKTVFSRIDILLPPAQAGEKGEILLMTTGQTEPLGDRLPYEEIAVKGSHITSRWTDKTSGREVIYCATPITLENETKGVLIGVIECNTLGSMFHSQYYGAETQIFLIDSSTGDYLMDTFHNELSNVAETQIENPLKGYENVDFEKEIAEGKTGALAFHSKTISKPVYMYYTHVEKYNWSVCMMVQEDRVFENVYVLQRILLIAGCCEGGLLLMFIAWNSYLVFIAMKNEAKARRAETERATNEAKSRFLSSVSHDIRTPLNGIIGMVDIINKQGKDGDPERMQDCLDKIKISANYLTTLVNDVLEINEMDKGKIVLTSERIDLCKLAEEVEVLVAPRAKERGIACYFDCSNLKHPNVMGSPSHLHRVLVNLISNAIKYNKENGEVWIWVDEFESSDEWGMYRFTVKDTGIGMTEKFQKTMFEAFEQENAGARTVNRGYGLGLTIVQRLVDQMRGIIKVKSKEGEGSTFTVVLPLSYAEELQEEGREEGLPLDLTGVNILLVEDNDLNMEIATVLLSDAGANVIPAANGREAVEKFASFSEGEIDVILMDLMMPEMDGCEATIAIRQMARSDAKQVPVIAMTASTFVEDVNRCKAAGMDEHIAKPLDMENVITTILKHVKR